MGNHLHERPGGAELRRGFGTAQSGVVTVTRSDAAHEITNPLYLGGYFALPEQFKVARWQTIRGNIYLVNSKGPFYWQGDTAWNTAIRAKFNRQATPNCAQGFRLEHDRLAVLREGSRRQAIHCHPDPGAAVYMAPLLKDTDGNAPFEGNSWASWNPPFWRGFEDKVQWANEKGLVVLVVA